MPPPNNPPLPLPAIEHAAAAAPRDNTNNPPPPEESRFEAALCLMNLVQRPLGTSTSATTDTPTFQPSSKQSSLSVVNPPPPSSTVSCASSQSDTTNNPNHKIICPPIQAFQITTTPTTTNKPPPPKKKKRVRLNYICTFPNCTNLVRKSGVCIRHGAQVKLCSFPNCKNHAKNGGVCRRHGASRPCGRSGCGNMVVKQGLCIKHWREEFDQGVVVGKKKNSRREEGMEFVRVPQQQMQKQSVGEEREREIAVAKLLAGQRGGNI